MRASSELQFGALRKVATRDLQGAQSRRGSSALSGGYPPDLASAESSSIVDKPEEVY